MSSSTLDNRRRYCYRAMKDTKKAVSVFQGAEKKCYAYKDFVTFTTPLYDLTEEGISRAMLLRVVKKKNAEYLRFHGISTPEIIDIEFKDDSIVEIQEKAPGKVLAYTNETNILKILKEDKLYSSFKDMGEDHRHDICCKLLKYNVGVQKDLKDAPLSHFAKFVRDFKDIQEYGLDLDRHGENFLYDNKRGFSFIDLPMIQSTPNKKFSLEDMESISKPIGKKKTKEIERYREVSNTQVVYQVCSLFADFLKYAGHVYDQDLVNRIMKNNTTLVDKVIAGSTMAGFNLTDEEKKKIKSMCNKFCKEGWRDKNKASQSVDVM